MKLSYLDAAVLAWRRSPLRCAPQIIERVLVKVNGDIFTQTELEEQQTAAIRARMGRRPQADIVNNNEELKKAMDEVTPQILVDAIDELLLLQMGKEKGYHLSDEQFKSWLDNLRKEQNLRTTSKFQAALKQEGMTIDDLRKNVEKQFLVGQVQRDEVGSKLADHRRRGAAVLPRRTRTNSSARDRHASRDPDRGSDDQQGRTGNDQRGAGRRGAAAGRGAFARGSSAARTSPRSRPKSRPRRPRPTAG